MRGGVDGAGVVEVWVIGDVHRIGSRDGFDDPSARGIITGGVGEVFGPGWTLARAPRRWWMVGFAMSQ